MPLISDIPIELCCPITHDLMEVPVSTVDGYVYDKKSIENWLLTNNLSPITALPLENKTLTENLEMTEKINRFLKENQITPFEQFLEAVKSGSIERVDQLNFLLSFIDAIDHSHQNYTRLHLTNFTFQIKLNQILTNLNLIDK